jgi:gluconolactonase
MKPIISTLSILFWFTSHAFAQEVLYRVWDVTPEHSFQPDIEGPAVDVHGDLFVVNYTANGTIARLPQGEKPELFLTLPKGSTGNGIRFDRRGRMYVADYTGHNVLRISPSKRKVKVFAHSAAFNQPNDLAISNRGILFCSDPNWKEGTGNLWRVSARGKLTLLESGMGTSNGIEVSPDDRFLYINESVQRRIWRYRLDKRGNLSDKQLFYQFEDFGLDGMRCDALGNLYVTRYDKGTIVVLSPDGTLLREIPTQGKKPSNVTFGGKDRKTIYITLQDRGCIEAFRGEFPGAR